MTEFSIEVHNLSKNFGKVNAVDNISFSIRKGSTTALLGGNGAGKTTTLSMLLGILYPTSGSISVLGHDMIKKRYAVLSKINFASPYADLPRKLTVFENLAVYSRLYSVKNWRERIKKLSKQFDIKEFLNRK